MALIGANASALLAASSTNNTSGLPTIGYIHPLIYQKRLSTTADDSSAQLLLVPTPRRTSVPVEITKTSLQNPNQVYDDISEAFDHNNKTLNRSKTVLINSKVNEYCYIPVNGLNLPSKPIQIVSSG